MQFLHLTCYLTPSNAYSLSYVSYHIPSQYPSPGFSLFAETPEASRLRAASYHFPAACGMEIREQT